MVKPFSHVRGRHKEIPWPWTCMQYASYSSSTDYSPLMQSKYCLLMTPQLVEQLHEWWEKLNNFGPAITFDAFFTVHTSKSMHTLTVMWTKNIGACSSIIYNICGFLPQNITKCISCIASVNVWTDCIVAGLFVQMLSVLHSSLSC